MELNKITSPDDPDRCQANSKYGQCTNKQIEGTKYCPMHGGDRTSNPARNYMLTKFQARLNRMADSPNIKSLRDEIGILRMTLEERLNQCKDSMDLIYQSGPISDLVIKIDKLVLSCHKIEYATGQLLDKQAILQFGTELVTILASEVKDEDILARLSNRITELIGRSFSPEDSEDD